MSRTHGARAARAQLRRAGRAAAALALAACVVSAALAAALAAPAQAGSARAGQQDGSLPVSLAITSASPAYAGPGRTVTVSGSITNTSAAAITGITVRLRSSSTAFTTRDDLQAYVDGKELAADGYESGAASGLINLAPHQTDRWSAALRVNAVGMTSFGVYPLAAEADAGGTALPGGTNRTFLPYWPGKHGGARQDIAWIWPIIDQPLQGACPGLLNNRLATSLAPGGRLAGLLAAGQAETAATNLTWAIDPSLLASVQAMKSSYRVGGTARCTGYRQLPASQAAATWLSDLAAATRGQAVFVTPYADVDIAALTRAGLYHDLSRAFSQGRTVASNILGRNFNPEPASRPGHASAARLLSGMAWPADGQANHTVLEQLAVNKVTAAVLDSSSMPPLPTAEPGSFTPATAVTSTPDGVDGDMRVLLADDTLTLILGSADSPSVPPGTAFAVKQRFLAETAMIGAQAPNVSRSIVVAPPRRWDPPPGLAKSLLAETASAPWLKPVSLGQLAAAKLTPGQPGLQPPASPAKGELSKRLLGQVRSLDRRVALLQSIRAVPDPALSLAMAGVESSAGRGGRAAGRQAQARLSLISQYLTSQQQALTITTPLPVTLGGLRGQVPVSISSGLPYDVRVRLGVQVVNNQRMTIIPPSAVKTIPAGKVVNIKLKVRAAAVGTTTVQLSLLTPDHKALPGAPVTMTIRATHYGTLALVILAAALGIFMITSAARGIRKGGGTSRKGDPAEPLPADADADAEAGEARQPVQAAPAGSVGPDHAVRQAAGGTDAASAAVPGMASGTGPGMAPGHDSTGPAPGMAPGHDSTEDTDELARAPGWADRG